MMVGCKYRYSCSRCWETTTRQSYWLFLFSAFGLVVYHKGHHSNFNKLLHSLVTHQPNTHFRNLSYAPLSMSQASFEQIYNGFSTGSRQCGVSEYDFLAVNAFLWARGFRGSNNWKPSLDERYVQYLMTKLNTGQWLELQRIYVTPIHGNSYLIESQA